MSININSSLYPNLKNYAVLSNTGITTTNTTTITNGNYGSSASSPSYTGTFVGTVDSVNAETAQTELVALIGSIDAYRTSGIPSSTLGNQTTDITLYPNINYNSGSSITFQNIPIILDAQGNNNAQFFITAVSTITFNNVPSITLINGASNCNVFWLSGSAISFTGTLPESIPGIFIAGTSITFVNACTILGRLYAQTVNVTFIGPSSVDAICTQNIVCYAKGTLILTKFGFVPIEHIKAGHKIVTNGKIYNNKIIENGSGLKVEPVTWVSKFKVIDLSSKSRPICIKRGALGKNYPFKDLCVSPSHNLVLNGRMISAKMLVNGKSIYQDNECEDVEYYHLECEHHTTIIANGVLSESYLDINNRDVFDNSVRIRPKNKLTKLWDLR
jgi:hypothetical protein